MVLSTEILPFSNRVKHEANFSKLQLCLGTGISRAQCISCTLFLKLFYFKTLFSFTLAK